MLAWVKLTEVILQARPRALYRTWLHPDAKLRHAMRWYTQMGRRVWPHEVLSFFFREQHTESGPTVEEMWGAPQESEERSMVPLHKLRRATRRSNEAA